MKRKSFYLFLLICSISLIASARQRYSNSCLNNAATDGVAKSKKAEQEKSCKGKAGADLSPVEFFVLNM